MIDESTKKKRNFGLELAGLVLVRWNGWRGIYGERGTENICWCCCKQRHNLRLI
jgi:hypothetical protein